MGNFYKIIVALFVAFFFFSFSKKNVKTNNYNQFTENLLVQDTLTWKLLGDIKYTKKITKEYGEVEFPVVNFKLKALQKKPIILSGFIIPIDAKNYAISKNVFAACFFCGKSGPETLAGIHFKNGLPKLKTDQYVTLKGNFRYNENDVNDWIYHIDNAEIVQK